MIKKDYILTSENFFSVQAEGFSTGVPAYFLRLSSCNFQCGLTHTTLQKIRKLVKEGKDSYSEEVIDLMHPEETSSWVCDTIPVWVAGHKKPFQYFVDDWISKGIKNDIDKGIIHLVWSGGEPTLPVNQQCIVSFLDWYTGELYREVYRDNNPMYNEIETNGTQYIENDLMLYLNQINCSAKLSNSGHLKEQRIVPDALKRIMEHPNYWFKFVISKEEDIEEITDDFVLPFNIPKQRVLLMPALSKQEDFHERNKFVLEMAKKYRFRATSRLHVSAYDQVVSV
jgi:7-carboxy-7-deazaguanine synthase